MRWSRGHNVCGSGGGTRRWRGIGWWPVVVTGGQEHRQPLRRARDGVAALRPLALLTGRRDVRDEGGAENGGNADEDERTGTPSTLLHLYRLR